MANRMKGLPGGIILATQSAFIIGRSTVDNVMIAFGTHHFLNRRKKKATKGGVCVTGVRYV